jgi:hypothetical protein
MFSASHRGASHSGIPVRLEREGCCRESSRDAAYASSASHRKVMFPVCKTKGRSMAPTLLSEVYGLIPIVHVGRPPIIAAAVFTGCPHDGEVSAH